MLKAVIIGFAHTHVNEVALYLSECPDFELAAMADARPGLENTEVFFCSPKWNLIRVREKYCEKFYDNYVQMLEEENPDMAFILAENTAKVEIVEECAKRGVNVCIEKPMASTLAEAKQIQACVKRYGIEAVVNWPVAWRPYIHKMKALVDQRIVGEPIKLRYINGHGGPIGKGVRHRGITEDLIEVTDEQRRRFWIYQQEFGGGIFLDISCYGCLFTKWMLGDGAKSVLSWGANLNTPCGDTEDNFAAIVKYDDTRMSVIEGTWSTPRAVIPSGPMMVCTDGVIMCTGGAEDHPEVKVIDMFGNELPAPAAEAEDKYRNMPWHYANHVKTGEPVHEILRLDTNVGIMAMIEALINGSASGKEELICE